MAPISPSTTAPRGSPSRSASPDQSSSAGRWSRSPRRRVLPEQAMQTPYSYRDDPAVPAFPDDRPVIIFDGECVLCSGSARFVLRHDKRRIYRFLAAQTPLGRALYVHYGLDARDYETMIVIADGVAPVKSEAVIRIAEGLRFPWSLAVLLRVIP